MSHLQRRQFLFATGALISRPRAEGRAPPAAMPVDQTPDLELAPDLPAARAIGLKVPLSILARADRVID